MHYKIKIFTIGSEKGTGDGCVLSAHTSVSGAVNVLKAFGVSISATDYLLRNAKQNLQSSTNTTDYHVQAMQFSFDNDAVMVGDQPNINEDL